MARASPSGGLPQGRVDGGQRSRARVHGPAVGRPSVMEESMSIGRQRVLQRASIELDKRQSQHAANQLTSWIERASRAEAKVLEQNHSSDPDSSAPLHEDS